MNLRIKLQDSPVGYRARETHCGTDRSMILKNTGRYYTAKCYRCGLDEYEPIGKLSLAQLSKQNKVGYEAANTVDMPSGCSVLTDSSPAMQYLLKFGIDPYVAASYGIKYHKGMDRVIFPVMSHGKVTWWLARALSREQKPKYIAPQVPKQGRVVVSREFYPDGVVVVVEDFISMMVVGRDYSCVSSLGTAIGSSLLSKLKRASKVIVWLDPDKAGREASEQLEGTLKMMGKAVEMVDSERDPKYYDRDAIREFIE